MTDGYQKSVQALIKKIQIVAIVMAVIIVAGVVFTSISKWKISEEEQTTPLVSEKVIFTPPPELRDAIESASYSYSFCQPDSARSGATCGGLAGATTNPYGGKPPYSFSHQFGVGFIPPGIALELNGLLRGTPTLPGDYTFGVCVTDLYEEVCKTTFLKVKPKSEKEIVVPEKEIVVPEETPAVLDVKIISLTCQWTVKKVYEWGAKIECVRTISKGTAQGPVGAQLTLNHIDWIDDKINCGTWTYDDSPATYNLCVRKEGQPETTTWTVDTGGEECPSKFSKASHSVSIYEAYDSMLYKADSKTVQCQ